MNPLQERRFITGVLLVAAAIGLLFAIVHFAYADDPFGGVPWPNHVEWKQYRTPDDSYRLIRPDSDTTFAVLPLPAGTEIYVPRLVPGRSPEAEQDSRFRKASR